MECAKIQKGAMSKKVDQIENEDKTHSPTICQFCTQDIQKNQTTPIFYTISFEVYVITMSRARFRVNLFPIVAWMPRNSLLEIVAVIYFEISESV